MSDESDEYHDVECGDSDDSFVSSLEQVVGTECSFTPDDIGMIQKDDVMVFDVDRSCERDGSILIEEIEEKTNIVVKITEENLSILSDTKNESLPGNQMGIVQVYETDHLRGGSNTTKITFYCESIDKLMADTVGDECEEIIQEITPCLTVVDSSV